jgi:hypothetical protein
MRRREQLRPARSSWRCRNPQASLLAEHISRAQQVTMLWRGSVRSEPVAAVHGVAQKRLRMTVFSKSQEVSRA